ncbi:uncharacterized protein RAG0_15210 [Rhynchosporium agropyri]|uniref:Uncharacterized protein n=1 Tax=Rhynchosporium agropyri TaxID=914238 RepID=A0A1E1LK52_9HELO|nr:uncharacterized protein RAG0_15210 [Rhynchosporium agropyri]
MAHPKSSSSSTKAHSGSHSGSSSHKFTSSQSHAPSHTSKHHSSPSSSSSPKNSTSNSKSVTNPETLERFVRDERDHRSYAVEQYDAYQEAEKRKREERLRDVVGKKY